MHNVHYARCTVLSGVCGDPSPAPLSPLTQYVNSPYGIYTSSLRYIAQVGKWKEVGSEGLTCIDACKRQENKIFTSESIFPSRVQNQF